MNVAYLLLGSNMGNRTAYLDQALNLLKNQVGAIEKTSLIYEADAWGHHEQDPFLNQVILIKTNLTPKELLTAILNIEAQMGRVRHDKWHQRIIDVDILFYDDLIVDEKELNIPHPHISERRFTLLPLSEIAPDLVHPECNKTVRELLDECSDPLQVSVFR